MGNSRIALVALALAWPFAACGATSDATTATAPITTTSAAPTASGDIVPAILQFSAPSVGGGAIDFTQFAGKPVVLWFWAPN